MTRKTRRQDRRRVATTKKSFVVQTPIDPETAWPRGMIGESAMREVKLEPGWLDKEIVSAKKLIASLPKALRDEIPTERAKREIVLREWSVEP